MSNLFLANTSSSLKEEGDYLLNEIEVPKDSSNSCKVLIWSIDPFTKKKVFLLQRGGNGDWGLPGGHVHINEPFEKAVVREVYEEIGLKIDSKRCKLILVTQRSTKRDKRGYVYFFEYEHADFRQIPRPAQIKPDSGFDRPEVMEIRWINSIHDLTCLDWMNTDNEISMISERLIKARLSNKESVDEKKYKKDIHRGQA